MSARKSKITNDGLTHMWYFCCVMNSYCLCATGEREVMPSQQDHGEYGTTHSQQNEERLL